MRRYGPAILCVLGASIGVYLVYGAMFLYYDASYSLVWAHDIAHHFTPDYNGFIAPTPHPLQTAVSYLALPFGQAAYGIMGWVILLSFGGLVWVLYLLGRDLFNKWVGIVAALVVVTRPAFEKNALLAYHDVPFVMFVIWALLLEIRKPRRGWPVLVLLGLAGLLRPDAWVLAILYYAYLFGRLSRNERIGLGALTAAAPVLWAFSDLLITGDPLHSLHGTADLATQLHRPRSPLSAPWWTLRFFGFTLREPLMIGVPIGLWFAWKYTRAKALLPIGLAVLMTVMFVSSTFFGLPLIGRYVLTPATLLTLAYGLACVGFTLLPAGSEERKRWTYIGIFSIALSIVFIPWNVRYIGEMRTKVRDFATIQDDLRTVANDPAFKTYYAVCGRRVSTTDHRPVPSLRFWVGGPPGSVQSSAAPGYPWAQIAIFPRTPTVADKFYDRIPDLTPPRGMRYKTAFTTKYWRVYVTPKCRAAAGFNRQGTRLRS